MTAQKMQSLYFSSYYISFSKSILIIQKMWAPENWSGPLNFKT